MNGHLSDEQIIKKYRDIIFNKNLNETALNPDISFDTPFKNRKYLTDKERRELVREFRQYMADDNEKEMNRIIERLWYEVEGATFKLADSLSSGGRSTRSGDYNYSTVHNDCEYLKAEGFLGLYKAVQGGTMTDKNGTRQIGFDPDGPGTFLGYMLKYIEGYMKNSHTRERIHFGLEKSSLDAPRGEDGTIDGHNFAYDTPSKEEGTVDYDQIIDSNLIQAFQQEDSLNAICSAVDDVATEKEKDIYYSLFGLGGDHKALSVTDVAKKFGISKQRVDQVRKKITGKLLDYFEHERTGKYSVPVEESEEERFILKVGDKFASSPLSKLTSNPNFAGVIHGKEEAEALMKYYKSRGQEEMELISWADRAKILGEAEDLENPENGGEQKGLNGLNLNQARKFLRKTWDNGDWGKGLKDDDSWQSVYGFFNVLSKLNIDWEVTDSEYSENQDGNPSGKTWKLEFKFQNQKGKDSVIYGSITASGAGTVEYPLAQYDLAFQAF